MTTDGDDPNAAHMEQGSRAEAVAAVVHHHHHPADPNVGVLRARPGKHVVATALVATAVTVLGVVMLALAVSSMGGGSR
jgi:hypothetical protein